MCVSRLKSVCVCVTASCVCVCVCVLSASEVLLQNELNSDVVTAGK